MHTERTLPSFNPFSQTGVTPRERRLISDTPENAAERQPAAPARADRANRPEQTIIRRQTEFNEMLRRALPDIMQEPGVRDAIAAGKTTKQDAGVETEKKGITQRTIEAVRKTGSPLSTSRHSTLVETGVTGGAIAGGAFAAMSPASFASFPALGKLATYLSGTLGSASAGVSNALTAVGAPASLSFLANPLFLSLGAPLLGLNMLGKYRIATLKAYYRQHKNDPKAQETLTKIEEYENRGLLARQWCSVIEGSRFVAGGILKPLSFVPKALGYATGHAGALLGDIGKGLGKATSIFKSPLKNIQHLAVGGLGAAGGGLLAGAAGATLLGTFAPWAVIGGIPAAIWAYRRSKYGKEGVPAASSAA